MNRGFFTYHYKIAGLTFNITADSRLAPLGNTQFIAEDGFTRDSTSSEAYNVISVVESFPKDEFYKRKDRNAIAFHQTGGENRADIYGFDDTLTHSIRWKEGSRDIQIVSCKPQALPFDGCAGEVLFRSVIMYHRGLVIHSSGIECDGIGIIFTAPSGTGKSTQADLWRMHRNARVLNGDRAALRFDGDTVNVYGTPWSGSSPDSRNEHAPLKAIVILEQAKENTLKRLTPQEAAWHLVPRCYLPYGIPSLLDLAFNNLNDIIYAVPVYMLKCKIGREAVDLVSSEVYQRDGSLGIFR